MESFLCCRFRDHTWNIRYCRNDTLVFGLQCGKLRTDCYCYNRMDLCFNRNCIRCLWVCKEEKFKEQSFVAAIHCSNFSSVLSRISDNDLISAKITNHCYFLQNKKGLLFCSDILPLSPLYSYVIIIVYFFSFHFSKRLIILTNAYGIALVFSW